MAKRSPPKKRVARGAQSHVRRKLQGRSGYDPQTERKRLLASETGTIFKEAPRRVALCYPLPYHTAMSSLGYQVIYRLMNAQPGWSAERFMLPSDLEECKRRNKAPLSIENGRPLGGFDALAFSITYDLDIVGFFEMLRFAGVPALCADRKDGHPPVIMGGPITTSNALPFGPFCDIVVMGDGELAVAALMTALDQACDKADLLERAAKLHGVWVPSVHGDRVPAVVKLSTEVLPAVGQIITPLTELSNMFLIETSRGCPRACKFCLIRNKESPMRESELDRVLSHIPEHAQRVGFVGAAVSEWSGIRPALSKMIESGRGVGVSSLRADRLDAEFVDLLARGGYRTMTIASDAPSQRLRNTLAKGIRTKHLLNATRLAKDAGMLKLKLYVIIGLPGETDADITELIDFSRELRQIMPMALGISPLVPKLHTPLGDAPFAGIPEVSRTLKRLRRELGGTCEVRSTSAKWAWVEYRMSQGSFGAGLAAFEAWKEGGGFGAWKRHLSTTPERPALEAANLHGLWAPAGMR